MYFLAPPPVRPHHGVLAEYLVIDRCAVTWGNLNTFFSKKTGALRVPDTAQSNNIFMHYFITGASGFLGTHLSARLLADGHAVIGLDNFHSGSEANIARLSLHPKFRSVRHDGANP